MGSILARQQIASDFNHLPQLKSRPDGPFGLSYKNPSIFILNEDAIFVKNPVAERHHPMGVIVSS